MHMRPPKLDGTPEVRELNLRAPNAARIYDFHLGGNHNTAADREAAREIESGSPHAGFLARSNRAFLHRAVNFCLESGIYQFLDLGSGIPTVGNVHEVACAAVPQARVVYVDNEDVAVAHTRRMLEDEPRAAMVHADLRDTEAVLSSGEVTELLDFREPVAVLLVAAMHYIGHHDGPEEILARYTAALPPGSVLVFSQVTHEERDQDELARIVEIFERTETPLTLRSRSEILTLLDGAGWELVEPGLVWSPLWRPDTSSTGEWPPEASNSWAGVALRRET